MKIKYNIRQFLLLAVVASSIFSCDSFVEVDVPKSQLAAPAVFEDYSTASAALTDIYSNIRNKGILNGDGTGISSQLSCYTDEMISTENVTNPALRFYTNSLVPTNTFVADYWNSAYNQIYAANSIIEGSSASTKLSEAQKKQLQGEAFFIRALIHFYLVNLFGDVPYITQTGYKQNSIVTRTPTAQVYEKIISDLDSSITLLSSQYIESQRVRPNALKAKALLAKVYIYTKAYPEASNTASAVLNSQELYNLENIDAVFRIESKETIWQLQSGASGKNTSEGSFFIFTSGPPQLVSLNSMFYNSFSSADARRSQWIKEVSDESGVWYHPYKYKENYDTAVSKEYSVVFRLAEQYLIRAEARAQQGDLIGAKEDLNKIRNRAGLPDTPAITQSEILEAVLNERKFEFFTEYGHRFFDLKRNDKLDSVLGAVKPNWETTDRLFPIPQAELGANPNLKPQNPGY
ncbi:MAG: RagB/SusD family nutrient uptake outer membrane protein [Flavobacterium sp.]